MKINESNPRGNGFILWGHCQNILDDPRIHTHTKTFVLKFYRMRNVWLFDAPSSMSSAAVMQIDDDLPVHLNVYISMFKQW